MQSDSNALGGVTTTESLTSTPTTTETDNQHPTYTDVQTATSSLTTSAGVVTGGGGNDSLQETWNDTHSSLIVGTGGSTGTVEALTSTSPELVRPRP